MDWPLAGDRLARLSRGGTHFLPDLATWLLATDPETHAVRKVEMEATDLPNGTKLEPKYPQAVLGEVPESPVVQKVRC